MFLFELIANDKQNEHRVLIHDENPPSNGSYQYKGIEVMVLPVPTTRNPRQAYFSLLYEKMELFERVLDTYQPDVVHFHDTGPFASLTHMQACKLRNIPTMLTYHSPGQSCLQRALLYGGTQPCNGLVDRARCSTCRYVERGISPSVAATLANISWQVPGMQKFFQRPSVDRFYFGWHKFMSYADVIQVHARWVTEMLVLNGLSIDKIRYVSMGGRPSLAPEKSTKRDGALKLVYVGRCADVKGVHVLVDAIMMLPSSMDIEVHFLGPYWNDAYGTMLWEKISNDQRFHKPKSLAPEDVVLELQSYDVCVVPSLWPETGPLSVLDAFAAGLPVVGTRHAGIYEKVRDNVDGLLFEWGNAKDLAEKIKLFSDDRVLLDRMRKAIRPNKKFSDFSREIAALYHSMKRNGN